MAQRGVEPQGDEVVVDGLVGLDLVALPDQAQLPFGVTPLQQADEAVAIKVFVFAAHGAATDAPTDSFSVSA
jgi:hypothetical protein